jgi:succinoglycan biosynthesis transport protein ExoP
LKVEAESIPPYIFNRANSLGLTLYRKIYELFISYVWSYNIPEILWIDKSAGEGINMRSAQIRLSEILRAYRRRWKLVVIPTIIVSIMCAIGAYLLPRKYEATTIMLIRPDQTFGRDFDDVDQLHNYGEIIFSRTFILALIDSLGIGRGIRTETERQGLINNVRGLIQTETRGTDSFSITFANADPGLAKRGAEVVANLFIETKVRIENRQNLLTIDFLEKKVEELRIQFENATRSLVISMQQSAAELPVETKSFYSQIGEVEATINSNDARTESYQKNLPILKTLPILFANSNTMRNAEDKQALLKLLGEDLPYIAELRALISRYDEETKRYTSKWPEIEKLETQIITLLGRIRVAMESEVAELAARRSDLERRRKTLIEQMKESSLMSRLNEDKKSSYDINQKVYNDMKVRLEQARLKTEVESKGANSYIILDPPILPMIPTKPNRKMLILLGFGLGFFLGIISVLIAELFDTTIRTSKDIEVYDKPVIALLPVGAREYL